LPERAKEIDGPLAAFITDLKQRKLFESTLIVWGGEFGRKPVRDRNGNDNPGRDHNAKAFTTILAGGGVKGGTVYGPPMNSAQPQCKTKSTSTICTRPSSRCSASITKNSLTATTDETSG
jgi:uncharacterized protein (DUF1501 family)